MSSTLLLGGLATDHLLTRGLGAGESPLTPSGYDGRDITEAVQLWWADQPALQALTSDGKLWLVEAPEDTALPYLTLLPVAEPESPDRTTGYYFLASTFQISAHDQVPELAVNLRNSVRDAIQGAALLVGGKAVWYCLPGTQHLMIGEGRGPNGSDCWMATVDVDAPWQHGG